MSQVNILLVEDNRADALFVKEGFKKSDLKPNVHVVEDGDEALDYLYKRNAYESAHTPDLVLLDLNLPRVDGLSVLKEIKHHPTLRRIPFMILTSSNAESDITKCYDNYANAYIVKPVGLQKMMHALTLVEQSWFELVRRVSQSIS